MRPPRPIRLPAAALLLALAACGAAAEAPVAAAPAETDPRQVTVGMEMTLTEAGRPKVDLEADTAFSRPGESRTELRRLRLVFHHPEPGRTPSRLTARSGDYDPQSAVMVARGDVVLVTQGDEGPRTIRTQELHFDQRGDRVWSDVETSITENGETLITQNFVSNSRFTNISGTDARSGRVRVGEGGLRF